MNLVKLAFFLASFLLVAGNVYSVDAGSAKDDSRVEELLKRTIQEIRSSPEKAATTIDQLNAIKDQLTDTQRTKFYLFSAANLGFRGRHKERVELVQSVLDQVQDPYYRVKLLYQMSSGFTNLGEYEKALQAMNQSVLLLPKLIDEDAKSDVLQAAISVLNSLHAYDEALLFADRMLALDTGKEKSDLKCMALGNQVEINFLRGERQRARSILPEAIQTCNSQRGKIISLLLNALACIDLIDSGNYLQGKGAALQTLQEFSKLNQSSDYGTQLEEALARAYLNTGNLEQAERYGLQSYQRAKDGNAVLIMEKTAETMASIKRAQGQYASSIEYYEAALVLKNRVLDDQLHKNLAFQRVKFDTQDKANQLNLLEQKNKILAVERELEKKNNQNLWLLISLVVVILIILSFWLLKTLQQKNQFRQFSQTDGLTQAANRMHFISFANEAFKMRTGSVSVILFDMDLFKNINDTHGHATGDWVLKSVSETVKTHLRKVDLFGRLGGEEFGICMPDSSQASALQLAERCRMAIAMIDTEPSGHIFSLSASFGVATVDGNGLRSFDETLEAADKALYRSKAEGRNCVNVYRQA
ncbi:tetratricopeptide repeat-containing diguanylate cyclase [Undibacterium sp. JH2W]|uniref:tetratricopeptide repeat-containing diguanylate cyclase n=1 Tax=Undibacterium sp. JH2W TaxID=3413037 RepID=UPI003BF344D6